METLQTDPQTNPQTNPQSDTPAGDQTDAQADALALPEQIQRYFEHLNQGEFEQAAALFAEDGQMLPPFEQPILGRAAIAQYLTAEASGMTMTPQRCEKPDPIIEIEGKQVSFIVGGKVKTSLFVVNVAWNFSLNEADEITQVKIKLLARLDELLKFKP